MATRKSTRALLRLAFMVGTAVFLLFALWILVPVLETDKDEPGVYRISADKTHEVIYLSHHYALHRFRGQDFVAATHYIGTHHAFATGDVATGAHLNDLRAVEKIEGLDGYILTTAESAATLINEEITIYPSREAAIEDLMTENWSVGDEIFRSGMSGCLKHVSGRVGYN